jgi:hypothetical protein
MADDGSRYDHCRLTAPERLVILKRLSDPASVQDTQKETWADAYRPHSTANPSSWVTRVIDPRGDPSRDGGLIVGRAARDRGENDSATALGPATYRSATASSRALE